MMSPDDTPPSSQASMTAGADHARNASRNAQTVPLEVCPTTVSTLDHPLLLPENTTEESAMMQHIMDLKLQLAECLSSNDTLRHRNRMLTKHNDQLIQEGSELAADLDAAYAQITKLKRERDEAVRDLTRARMLQIRQDSSRRAKLLADKDNSGDIQSENGSGRSLHVSKSKSGTNSFKDANNKGGNWLSRLGVNFKASSSHHGDISPSPPTKVVDPNSSSFKLTKTASIATLQSISDSTRNLFNNSTLSFLSSDTLGLSSESLAVVDHRRGQQQQQQQQRQRSSSSLLAANEDSLPGRRSSIACTGAPSCTDTKDANSLAMTTTKQAQERYMYAHRNTDRDVQDFLSRHSMSSIDSGLIGESDSEEEFDDYLANEVPRDRHASACTRRERQDDGDEDSQDYDACNDNAKSTTAPPARTKLS